MTDSGVLIVNLGTPASPEVADVKAYLKDFLMDPYVIDLPAPLRWLLVNVLILPRRPQQTAEAYQQIWQDSGSPLLHHSVEFQQALTELTSAPVELGMRYGEPNLSAAIEKLLAKGVQRIVLVPLYPHYAESTVRTIEDRVESLLGQRARLQTIAPFYAHEGYINAQASVIEQHLSSKHDHLLLSYHGLPLSHLRKVNKHCLSSAQCCDAPHTAHERCYRAQVLATSRLLKAKLNLTDERCSSSFQSRLGMNKWLPPYTDEVLQQLAQRGVKRLLVACPAFVADNLETLEEVAIRGAETFIAAGGEQLDLVPSLNVNQHWLEFMASYIEQYLSSPILATA